MVIVLVQLLWNEMNRPQRFMRPSAGGFQKKTESQEPKLLEIHDEPSLALATAIVLDSVTSHPSVRKHEQRSESPVHPMKFAPVG